MKSKRLANLRKTKIPKAVRSQVWITFIGKRFLHKCTVAFCKNILNPFNFEVGHNIPFSKGGKTIIGNLRPICSQCNKSMGDRYSITEFSSKFI